MIKLGNMNIFPHKLDNKLDFCKDDNFWMINVKFINFFKALLVHIRLNSIQFSSYCMFYNEKNLNFAIQFKMMTH